MQVDVATSSAQRARFELRARRQATRVSRRIVGVAVSIVVGMWAFIAGALWVDFNGAERGGRTQGFNLTAAFAGELALTFDSVAETLRLINAAVASAPDGGSVKAVLEGLTLRRPMVGGQMTDMRVFGRDGRLVYSSLTPNGGPHDVSQTAHFQRHRDVAGVGLMIEPPAADPVRQRDEFVVAERLATAGGGFAGEIELLLKPAMLISLRQQIDLGRRGIVAIIGTDGLLRVGFDHDHPNGALGAAGDLLGETPAPMVAPGDTRTFVRTDPSDGTRRLITVRRLERYPLCVVVGLDMADVLRSAWLHAWMVCLVGAGTTGLIAVMTMLLVREVLRRTTREIELSFDREKLQTAQDQITADRVRLEAASRELRASKERAETASRAKSQFLAHMSHELRTPLHAIIGFSELIQDQAPNKAGSPPIAGYAQDIWTSGRHLLDLINTILDISKIESGTATLAETVFPVGEMARNAMVSVRSQAEARSLTLELRLPDGPMRLHADRTRLLQVLINLLSNAVKFTPEHGSVVVAVSLLADGELMLSVTDSGIGMTEAEIMVALEPFGQVDNALSRSFEGTGLGLPLARRLTELHGGRLELSSIKGRGTAARVILPATRVAQRASVAG